ncbi:MAG: type VI secretion system baseplate subunit TssF [Smithella sp.]
MSNKYYQQEINHLRELAVEFSRAYPEIAPMLSGPSADPDVERLLEGTAFLTGLLREKLEDDFPEIIHGLMNIILPHYIRPIPSTSIVAFYPKRGLKETISVPAGTSLETIPIEGTSCIFKTCFKVDVHPFKLVSVDSTQKTGLKNQIRLTIELTSSDLSNWNPDSLNFLLGGSFTESTDLFMLLNHYLQKITLRSVEGGNEYVLPANSLKPAGFDMKNALLPFPGNAFTGYRLLQEYFILPRKFLFFELTGWKDWHERGRGRRLEIIFDLFPSPITLPKIKDDHFIFSATPVVNLFVREGEPVTVNHFQEKIRLRPSSRNMQHFQIYSVDKVSGYSQGSVKKREYVPLEMFRHANPDSVSYEISRSRSPVDDASEVFLSIAYPSGTSEAINETLSVAMTCTNGDLPERLQLGDICRQTSDSPELLEFRNIIAPTSAVEPPVGKNTIWRFLSHISLNYLSIANADNIKEVLSLYAYPEGRDREKITANLRRIEGITGLNIAPVDRLTNGLMLRGQTIELTARQDHFAGLGDLYLFAAVLDLFFAVYSSFNSFTQLKLKESISGETFTWPFRMGNRILL